MLGSVTQARGASPNLPKMEQVQIRTQLTLEDVHAIVHLHGDLYHREQGWDRTFEQYVSRPLAEFAARSNVRERIWIVENGGELAGSIALVAASATAAQLRWFLVTPELRGKGIGSRLLTEALAFAKVCNYTTVFLWTAAGLDAARRLYERTGFILKEQKTGWIWGAEVSEQCFELKL